MFAFAPCTPVAAAKPALGASSFATPLADRPAAAPAGPTMVLRVGLRKSMGAVSTYAGAATILAKADTYMADSVRSQYLNRSNASGVFGVQCTEGSVKFAAEVSRVRALNARFRALQASPSKRSFDLFENRKAAIVAGHNCHHEESQFCDYSKVSAMYNVSRSEHLGTCSRYATPETVEEAAMMRYMDIQQNNAANPSGVYNTWCNEGAAKGQAEDIRVAALNSAFRQGQKSAIKIMDEKYQQKKAGYDACHGCNYEEGLVSKYPAIGASFRSKAYGY